MPWKVIDSQIFWWPSDIPLDQKEVLSHFAQWPRLYVAGTAEDDDVIEYLQKIGQPFQMLDIARESTEEKFILHLASDRPAFWTPALATDALVGLGDIERQFEYRAWCLHIPAVASRLAVTLPEHSAQRRST